MKKIFLLVCFLFIATSLFAQDTKIYDSNYKYVGKISEKTGFIYDKNYKRVGKIENEKIYDKNYKRVYSIPVKKK